jgi:cell division protein FtsA
MTTDHTIGIDFGTNTIKIIVTEPVLNGPSRIITNIESAAHGFRHGYIVDQEKAAESLNSALQKLAAQGIKGNTARIALGGVGLKSQYVRTSLEQIKNNEVNERHVHEVIQKAEDLFAEKYPNKKILHIIPTKYRVDGRDVLGAPIGMYGSSIEAKVIFITILEHHYDAVISILEKNNVEVIDSIASPIADAAASLNYKQQSQGCMIANIGAETTSFSTFENGNITSLDIISIGSNDITNDIALGLQISLEEADNIKKGLKHDQPKRKVDEIIQARLADILELAEKHLIKIKKSRLLPAGIIFTGGGSHIENINNYAKQELKLPSEEVTLHKISRKTKRSMRVPNQFSVAYGLCNSDSGRTIPRKKFSFRKMRKTVSDFISQIMP